MKKHKELAAAQLRAKLNPADIAYETSDHIPRNSNCHPPQHRAMQALELSLHIKDKGYNIYVSGDLHMGRTHLLTDFLRPKARKAPTPPDILYVHNFDDPDSPRLIQVPAGQGKRLKTALAATLTRIRKEVPVRFENDSFARKRSSLVDKFQTRRDHLFKKMAAVAGTQGFNLDMDEQGGMTLYPLVAGKRLSEQEFEGLAAEQRKVLRSKGDALISAMAGLVRKLSRLEQVFLDDERSLEKEVAAEVLNRLLTPLGERFVAACGSAELRRHFEDIRKHILESLDSFLPRDIVEPGGIGARFPQQAGMAAPPPYGQDGVAGTNDSSARCEVNLFVDNSQTSGAPIIFCDHPTPAHLLGCFEREAEMGALITDFSLIKAGDLQKANGGYLIMRIEELLHHPAAWEGLLRALRSGFSRIEDAGDSDAGKSKSLNPEPLALALKVILIGDDDLYETLLLGDGRFEKLFKIKAQLADHMARNSRGIRIYLSCIRRIIDDAGLPPFTREALAGLVDVGSGLIEDQKKLSLKFPLIRDIMLESAALAAMRGQKSVTGEILREALNAKVFRMNLVEEAFMEEYGRKLLRVATSGEAVGRVNGISVTWHGDFEFGLPHQIAATVGVGHDGIIDLEREAKLGGPIHTKAMLILKSYLVSQFARNKPLVLSGSLCFEQSYAGIEGDSASGAELAALLSALAETPISLALAFTGAVSQSGHIMAVSSVTRKVEGFFEVCRSHGLTGLQGVILPRDNLDHLMLKEEAAAAVEDGKFHLYPVGHICEAMELLTGAPAGVLRKNGRFTPHSLFDRADRRLMELTRLAAKYRGKN